MPDTTTENQPVLQTEQKTDFKAAVGLSRKWNAREAGREVIINTLNQLGKNVKPNFILLFSTIHYEKHGGFQELLNGVWDILPKGTPLIGGTVAGFINPQGCYTRGVTALAVNYPNMDVAIGIGHNTKRTPHLAAKQCAQQIKQKLDKSKYENGLVIDLISGGLIFEIPLIGRRRVFRDIPGRLSDITSRITSLLLSRGPGKEEEVLKEFTTQLAGFKVLSGSCMDNSTFVSNYQFYNGEVHENSIVSIALKIDLRLDIQRGHGLSKTHKQFRVTKSSSDSRFIYEINGKPALQEFLSLMSWPERFLTEKNLHNTTLYYPLGFNHEGEMAIDVIALISGNSLCMVHKVRNDTLHILSASGRELMTAVDDCLKTFSEHRPELGFIFSCGIRLDTLGSKIYITRDKLIDYFKEKPFLLTYVTGEGVYKPSQGLQYGNDTFNLSVLWRD